MNLNVKGNPGENNSFQENQISKVGNYYQNATFEGMGSASTRMGSYFQKLLDEIRGEVKDEVIDELLWYKTKLDGKKDMEEKLTDGRFRPAKIMEAKHFKEMYAKKALQYDCYPSAQKINLTLFARIKHEFDTSVYPLIEQGKPLNEVMCQIREKIVSPIMELIETSGTHDEYLNYTEDHIYGMIYYLTGNCHLNWKDYDNL